MLILWLSNSRLEGIIPYSNLDSPLTCVSQSYALMQVLQSSPLAVATALCLVFNELHPGLTMWAPNCAVFHPQNMLLARVKPAAAALAAAQSVSTSYCETIDMYSSPSPWPKSNDPQHPADVCVLECQHPGAPICRWYINGHSTVAA